MILNLTVSNYILIEHLSFDFTKGLMVVTGETGAGKSIFIHALSLLLGQRLNKEIVGPFDEKALIEGVFVFDSQSNAHHKMIEAGFELDDEYIFSRQVDANGKSIYRINRQMVPLSLVKDILMEEIDIHSQFNTQGLLDEKNHLFYIDQLVEDKEIFTEVDDAYHLYRNLIKQKEEFQKHQLSEFESQQLQKEINKLMDLNLSLDEEESILTQLHQMKLDQTNLKQIHQLQHLFESLNYQQLYPFLHSGLSEQFNELVNNAYYSLEELEGQVDKLIHDSSFDEEVFESLNERAYVYSQTKRRLNRDVKEILEYIEESKNLIEDNLDSQRTLDRYDQKIEEAYQQYIKLGQRLSSIREQAAQSFVSELENHAADLSLNNFQFKVNFIPEQSAKGLERAQFMMSLNKGQSLQPLASVASGGELSRVMLALKVIFNMNEPTKLIVFDEIDTGVSGRVAQLMGVKMTQLAKQHCLLVVTHLPIIAAFGDRHFVVIKSDDQNQTLVSISELNNQQRLEQLAMMLSSTVNSSSLDAAKDLINQSQDLKA